MTDLGPMTDNERAEIRRTFPRDSWVKRLLDERDALAAEVKAAEVLRRKLAAMAERLIGKERKR